MKRVILMIIPALICGVVFTSCGTKASTEDLPFIKLEGTEWEAKTKDAVIKLQFIDETECTIRSSRTDGTYSMNLSSYTWSYVSDNDSKWGSFHLYHKFIELPVAGSGIIESGKLYLVLYFEGDEYQDIWFTRKK